MSALERAWAFDRELRERCAARVERFELGAALFDDALPRVYDANVVRLDRGYGELSTDEVADLADSFHGDLGHRKVLLPDAAAGDRLMRELGGCGWSSTRTVVMEYAGARTRDVDAARKAELVDPRAVRGAREGSLEGDRALQRQVADYTERLARSCEARTFAAFDDGEVGSFCALYEEDGVAEIDEVTTLPRFRGRGLATAVVEAALGVSLAERNELTFVVADDADWPKGWYRRLGFRPVGYRFELYRSA